MTKRLRLLTRPLFWLQPRHTTYLLVHLVLFFVGICLVQIGGAIWVGCGSSVIAAALTGWVVFVYVLLSQRTSDQLEVLSRFGIKTAFERRSMQIKEEYGRRLQLASRQIDVMGFGQRALRQDFADQFGTWSQRASVRILLIDPEYPTKSKSFADQRDREEANSAGTIRDDVSEFIKRSKSLLKSQGSTFCVRLYTCLPSVNIFRIDDELFWGPYLLGEQSRNLPTFLVQDGGILFEHLTRHFDRIWSDNAFSRPVPADWLED